MSNAHPFLVEKKSDIFQNPFPASLSDAAQQWKEKVPGEYKVAKCGKAGHNIRYNPSLKAAPIGESAFLMRFLRLKMFLNALCNGLRKVNSSLYSWCN